MVNLLERSLSMALLFISSITTSVSDPPIWNPTLPPSTFTPAGADQPRPFWFLHTIKRRPYFAPTVKAPFFTFGTTTAQAALSSKSCGIPLSGVAMISFSTSAAALSRLAVSLLVAARAAEALIKCPALITRAARAVASINFLTLIFSASAFRLTLFCIHTPAVLNSQLELHVWLLAVPQSKMHSLTTDLKSKVIYSDFRYSTRFQPERAG